jgi:hypothetical protein
MLNPYIYGADSLLNLVTLEQYIFGFTDNPASERQGSVGSPFEGSKYRILISMPQVMLSP